MTPQGPRGVATYHEFVDALAEVGLVGAAELEPFAADSAGDVLGLSRALVKAGKLTSYQAAAVYQKKSRGLLIGDYLILDKLGQGGMGMVFKARHRTLRRVGALKILPPSFTRDRAAVLRFRREFEAAGRLRHLNVVAAFEAAEDRGVHFLVMDYVRGLTLDRVVGEQGPLPVAEAVDYLIQSARGLEAAHEKGIVHRDIKPGNLMLDREGTVRVLDLGLARIVDAANPLHSGIAGRLTQTGMYMGTVDYMSPEQAEDSHNVDHRADIYSLGCTLYFLLTGREPFPGPTILKRMMAHQEHPAPSLRAIRPEVSPALEAAYQKMMAKRPEDRPGSMGLLIALLHESRPSGDDPGPVGLPPEPGLARAVTEQRPLGRGGPPRTAIDTAIFARRMDGEDRSSNRELSLRDLVMDVRSEVYGVGETGADRDEAEGGGDERELSLRELAQELGEKEPRALAPEPPGAPARSQERTGAPQQDDTPPGAPIPGVAARPLKRAAGPRQGPAPPAAPRQTAAEVRPPKRTATPQQPETEPGASKPPSAEKPPLQPAAMPRPGDPPPAAPRPPAAGRQPLKQASEKRSGDWDANKGVAILAVVSVILLILAVVVSIASRSTVAEKDEASMPAADSLESEGSPNVVPEPPVPGEP